jgi:hypothetical protein
VTRATKELSAAMKEKQLLAARALRDLAEYEKREAEIEEQLRKSAQAEKELAASRALRDMARYDDAEAEAQRKYEGEVEAAKRAHDAILADWQKTADQMGQSLMDALMTGGKSVAEYLRSLFRTLVLRPILAPIGGALGGLTAGVANAATGGGGMGGLGMVGSALGGLGTFGSYAATGFMSTLTGAGGAAFGAAGSLLGSGSIAGGLGMAAGAALPWVAAGYMLWKNKDKIFGGELKESGFTGTYSASGFSGQSYRKIGGGWFHSDDTRRSAMNPAMDAALDAGVTAAYATARQYAEALGLPVAAVDGFTKAIKLNLKGLSAEEIQQKIAKAKQFERQLEPFRRAGETLGQTFERLAVLEQFSGTLNDLGGVFSRLAGLSVDAREHLIELAGGMEALGSQAMQFVQDYYSRDEIAGLKASEVLEALQAVGIDGSSLSSREDYRALVDSTNVSTEAGREQLAALLALGQSYGDVADYLAESGGTLGSAAAQAPTSGALPTMFTSDPAQLSATNALNVTMAQAVDLLQQLVEASVNKTPIQLIVPEVNWNNP